MRTIVAIIKSMRPLQWVKNLFVFAGLIFAQEFLDIHKLLLSCAAFAAFCLLASGVYLFNDIIDLPHDKVHPRKRERPLPAGELPVWLAALCSFVFIAVGLAWALHLHEGLAIVGMIYIFLQLLYTFILKRLVIVDIIVVASGFLLRAIAGAVVLDVAISSWLLLCTSLLALFMVTAKRRQELIRVIEQGVAPSRDVICQYPQAFLDELLTIEAYGAMLSYAIYVFDPGTAERFGTPYLGVSLPFVLYGILRYLYLVKVGGRGESPERLVVSDPIFLINLLLWVASIIIIIYFA